MSPHAIALQSGSKNLRDNHDAALVVGFDFERLTLRHTIDDVLPVFRLCGEVSAFNVQAQAGPVAYNVSVASDLECELDVRRLHPDRGRFCGVQRTVDPGAFSGTGVRCHGALTEENGHRCGSRDPCAIHIVVDHDAGVGIASADQGVGLRFGAGVQRDRSGSQCGKRTQCKNLFHRIPLQVQGVRSLMFDFLPCQIMVGGTL